MPVRSWIALASLLLVSVIQADDIYRLDGRNTEVSFVGSKKDGKHDGGFKEIKGTITVKGDDVTTSAFKVDIDMKSVYTDNEMLTGHLKTADFFNVNKWPTSKFVSSKVEKKGNKFEVLGKLTLNGVTKDIVIPATIDLSSSGFSMESNFEINRHDWKINYKPKDIDEKVKITLKVTAPK